MMTTVLTSIVTAFGTALVTTLASFILQERRIKFEFAQMRKINFALHKNSKIILGIDP